jgi:peptidoglycan/xylan/chitin deacetylase (PgdA/CDA1 family)
VKGKLELAARVLDVSGLGTLLRRRVPWRGVLVLNYHRIVEDQRQLAAPGVWSATPATFREQVRFLATHCDPIGVDQLEDRLHARRPSVLVTVDDGYRDGVELALPILREHGVPATFFLTTGFLDRTASAWWDEIAWMVTRSPDGTAMARDRCRAAFGLAGGAEDDIVDAVIRQYQRLPLYAQQPFLERLAKVTRSGRRPQHDDDGDWMHWDDARQLVRAGMTIGAHTVTHPVLASLSPERQREEIVGSLARIEQELGRRPQVFSYPVGARLAFDHRSRAAAAASGVRLAFSNYGGLARPQHWDPYDVPRANVGRVTTGAAFRAMSAAPRVFARW